MRVRRSPSSPKDIDWGAAPLHAIAAMPSSIDDPSAGLLGDEEAPGDCHSAVRGIGVVTLAFGGLVVTNVCVLLFKELSQIDGEYLYNPASALCMAEIGKFLVSCCVRLATKQAYEPFLPKTVPVELSWACLLYTSPSPRDKRQSRMPSSA